MFYYIEGKLAHLDYGFAVVDANGVGYKMTITQTTYESMPPHLSVSEAPIVRLYTYMAVREDGVELFGFSSESELEAFKMLITVSGVGPKAAVAILSVFTPDKLFITIMNEDTKAISKANGIGAKTAARIILELKDKISKTFAEAPTVPSPAGNVPSAPAGASKLSDAQSALLVLGYTKSEVVAALRGVDISNKDTDDIIRIALKNLSKFGG
ncbi:MAG: Holliday junction branch migration protein RuvA [Clostridia bacterium]|nr:Holliday junction branch migration protein RuvA [Clostridia bacterium]